jgi:L-2-hydroxyglutarate oxidase LhgO
MKFLPSLMIQLMQNTSMKYDVVIAGGGIIGLAVANAILEFEPNLRIIVIEKEESVGLHASGRNSGVMHAGFYYSPDSLKAKFCREGNLEIKKLAIKHNFEVRNIGKVVVARNENEYTELIRLYERGLTNGVQLELLPASKLPNFEPQARTFEGFLWSPTTAISSPTDVVQSIRNELLSKKVDFAFGAELKVLDKNTFQINERKLFAKHFINAAGSNSDRLAHKFEVGKEFVMAPFLGVYRVASNSGLRLQRLVYPVPHKINPFLGVHLTLTLDGTIKVGPSAIPILGREQYSIRDFPSVRDVFSTSRGLLSIAKGEKHKLRAMIRTEYPNFYLKKIISLASELVPGVANLTDWSRKPPGIRAQLVDTRKGELVQDFVVRSGVNSTHILNTVSPGWTSAIPFAKYIASEYVLPSLE